MITLNGKDLDFSFSLTNADTMERYENAQEALSTDEKDAETATGKASEQIRRHCQNIFKFFDAIFGDGAAKLIFGDEVDFSTCFDVLEELYVYADKQSAAREAKYSKYQPNRAERRKQK